MDAKQLQEIRERHNVATPGPWGLFDEANDHCMVCLDTHPYEYIADVWHENDLPIIANAYQDISDLLNAVDRSREALEMVEFARDDAGVIFCPWCKARPKIVHIWSDASDIIHDPDCPRQIALFGEDW